MMEIDSPRIVDEYSGHICATIEPGCTCHDHADAFRERDRLRTEVQTLREWMYVVMTKAVIEMDKPRLMSIGRGSVDARRVTGIIDILFGDFRWREDAGNIPLPSYAKSEIFCVGFNILSPLSAAELIDLWRKALDMPEGCS